VVTIGIIRAGTATNIIPDQVILEGTARTVSQTARAAVKAAVHRRINGVAAAAGCTAKIDWTEGYPATINDPSMADYVAKISREFLGPQRFIPIGRPTMGGEDFAYYTEKVPGCFFLIGIQPADRQEFPPLHNDHYDFTDAAIAVGTRMFISLVSNFQV
jgi:metal-dependent amidase/aminoacylase/carboxypeptidase family protein